EKGRVVPPPLDEAMPLPAGLGNPLLQLCVVHGSLPKRFTYLDYSLWSSFCKNGSLTEFSCTRRRIRLPMANRQRMLRTPYRECPVTWPATPTRRGPVMVANLPEMLKKPKNSADCSGGTNLPKKLR